MSSLGTRVCLSHSWCINWVSFQWWRRTVTVHRWQGSLQTALTTIKLFKLKDITLFKITPSYKLLKTILKHWASSAVSHFSCLIVIFNPHSLTPMQLAICKVYSRVSYNSYSWLLTITQRAKWLDRNFGYYWGVDQFQNTTNTGVAFGS